MKLKSKPIVVLFIFTLIISLITSCTFISFMRWQRLTIDEKADLINEKLTERLDLNETQQSQLNAMSKEIVQKMKSQKTARIQNRKQFIDLIRKDTIDREKLKEIAEKHEKMKKEIKLLWVAKFIEFHGILTSEQRNKLADRIDELSKRFYNEK